MWDGGQPWVLLSNCFCPWHSGEAIYQLRSESKKHKSFIFVFSILCLCVYVGHVWVQVHLWNSYQLRSEDNFQELLPSSTFLWALESKHGSLALWSKRLSHWPILLTQEETWTSMNKTFIICLWDGVSTIGLLWLLTDGNKSPFYPHRRWVSTHPLSVIIHKNFQLCLSGKVHQRMNPILRTWNHLRSWIQQYPEPDKGYEFLPQILVLTSFFGLFS